MKKIISVSVAAMVIIAACMLFLGCASTGGTTGSREPVMVTYLAGEGASGEGPDAVSAAVGSRIVLAGNPFFRRGYYFNGWSDGSRTYRQGDSVRINADMQFTAQWAQATNVRMLLSPDAEDMTWETIPQAEFLTEGERGYYEITHNDDLVFVWRDGTMDLSEFARNSGRLHLSVYVDNPGPITGGQFEITSSGTADIDEWTFGEFGSGQYRLIQGWNTFVIPLSEAHRLGNPNWAQIDFFRFYLNPVARVTVRVSDVYLFY